MAFKVNLIPNREFTVIHLNQYEYGVGNTRTVAIYNGDVPFDIPSGSDVTIEGVKPDGNAFAYNEGITFEDNEVTFELQDQMTVLAGQFPVEIVIRNSQGRWSTKNLIFDVEAGPVNENTPISDEDIPAYIELAQRNANRAVSAASTATSAASTATTAANTATSKASTATTAATTATTAANTATSKASTATTAASTATTAAANAKVSEDNAKDSEIIAKTAADDVRPIITEVGNVVTTENAKPEKLFYLKADLEPKQDLNGYNHPWAGGAGKNLLPSEFISATANGITFTKNADGSVKASGTATAVATRTVDFVLKAGDYVLSGCPSNGSSATYEIQIESSGTYYRDYGSGKAFTLTEDANVRCTLVVRRDQTVNITYYPMICLASETDLTYEPYENICPISGYTGVTVTRTGKNLIDINAFNGTGKSEKQRCTLTIADDGVTTVTCTTAGVVWIGCASTVGGSIGNYYVIDIGYGARIVSENEYAVYEVAADGTVLRNSGAIAGGTVYTASDPNCRKIGFRFNFGTMTVGQTVKFYPMIRLASETDSTYEAYNGATYPVTFPTAAGTVYGGTLTINSDGSGTLTVDRTAVALNGTNYPVGQTGSGISNPVLIQAIVPNIALVSTTDSTKIVSDYLPPTSDSAIYTSGNLGVAVHYATAEAARRIWMRLPNVTTEAEAKTYLASNPLTVVYPLATPTTYALTNLQVVEMLENKNTIWTDNSDHIEISYRNISKLNDYLDTMRGVSYDDITEAGTVTETGKKVVDAVQLNPNVNGTIAKRLAAVESTEVKKTDISRATNITSTGSKVVDAYELNASKSGTLAKKISDNTTNITKNTTALGGFSFGTTSDGKPGYKAPGADSVVPFKNGGFKKIGSLTTTFAYNIKYNIAMNVDVTDYDYIFAIEEYTAAVTVNSVHQYTVGTTNFYSSSQVDEASGSSSSGVADSLKTIVMNTSEITGSVDISVTEKTSNNTLGAGTITLYGVYGENGDSGSSSTRTDIIASVTGEFNTTLKTLTSSVDLSRYDLICIFEDDRPNAVHPYANLEFVFKDTTSGTELFKKYHWHHHNAGGQDPRSDPNNNVWSMLIPVEDINNTVSITVKNTDGNTPQPNGTITIYGFRKADAIKSGEALLVAFGSTGATIWFSKISNGTIGGDMTFYNLDFSDVKSFTFDFSNTSTGESDRNAVTITDSSGTTIMSATSGTCEINGRTGVKIKAEGVNGTNGAPNRVLKFFSYTDMNNNVHTL